MGRQDIRRGQMAAFKAYNYDDLTITTMAEMRCYKKVHHRRFNPSCSSIQIEQRSLSCLAHTCNSKFSRSMLVKFRWLLKFLWLLKTMMELQRSCAFSIRSTRECQRRHNFSSSNTRYFGELPTTSQFYTGNALSRLRLRAKHRIDESVSFASNVSLGKSERPEIIPGEPPTDSTTIHLPHVVNGTSSKTVDFGHHDKTFENDSKDKIVDHSNDLSSSRSQSTGFVYGNMALVEEESSDLFEKRPRLTEIDVRYNLKSPLHYDPALERYVPSDDHHHHDHRQHVSIQSTALRQAQVRRRIPGRRLVRKIRQRFWPSIVSAFIPEGVSPNYFTFMKWRIFQRYISANVHVLTTQSLLMGLGIKSAGKGSSSRAAALGVSAAVNWVLKDALGKISRMVWASKMGRKFDSDAKRWRFRSSLLFATGSGLEVVTYLYPHLFLVLATIANSLKQMSMLTSSATRNAIYNSFRMADDSALGHNSRRRTNEGNAKPTDAPLSIGAQTSRPNKARGKAEAPLRENIGDITAKGEAQIATVDLLGIGSGVILSKLIGVDSMARILGTYCALQISEMFCMYKLTRSVVFNMLNFERLYGMVEAVVDHQQPLMRAKEQSTGSTGSGGTVVHRNGAMPSKATMMTLEEMETLLPTPTEAAKTEKIFLPPTHLGRKAIAFGSIGRAKLSPEELSELLNIFKGERYLIVVGENVKHANQNKGRNPEERMREHCHVVLHKDATNIDVVQSIITLGLLRQELAQRAIDNPEYALGMRSSDCYQILQECKEKAHYLMPLFVEGLEHNGWSTSRFMFGRVSMRAEWDIIEDDQEGEMES